MSLRQNTSQMMAEKLPQKRSTTSNGLRKRPQFEQIVNYIANGQETIKYPDRIAKQIRNHPFMTQLDFFDMQEDQHRSWEEQVRQREAVQLAGAMGITAAQARAAAGPYGGGGAGPMGGGYGPILNRGGGRGGGGVIGPAGPQVGPARPQPQAGPQPGAAGPQPGAAGPAGNYGPARYGGAPGAGPARTRLIGKQNTYGQMTPGVQPVPSGVLGQLASQDASATASADQMMVDATQQAKEALDREHARRSAAASAAAASLYPTGVPTQQEASSSSGAAASSGVLTQQGVDQGAAASSSGGKGKGKDTEMQKRLVAKNMGTSVNMMDAQAQALQDAAKKADAQLTQAAIQKPVPKKKPLGRPTTTIQVQKGPATKGTVSAPVLKHASEVKKINQAESARLAKMQTTSGQETITIERQAKTRKPAKPVKKVQLKNKPSDLAKEIKKSVGRKGAVVKKETPSAETRREKALQLKEKKYSETEVPTPKLAIGPRKQKGSKSGKSSKGRKRTVIIM